MGKQSVIQARTDADTETSLPARRVEPVALTPRQENFAVLVASGIPYVEAYESSYNAAGLARGSLRANAHRAVHHPRVAARIRELQDAVGARALRDTQALVRDLEAAVDADASELVQLLNGSCRRCWGDGGKAQWASVDEFVEACDEAARHNDALPPGAPAHLRKPVPDEGGGFAYTFHRDPNPECVGCSGTGVNRIKFNSTADASPGARRLIRGFETWPNGDIKRLHLADQTALRIELHRLRGLHVDRSLNVNLNASVPTPKDLTHEQALDYLDRLKPLP